MAAFYLTWIAAFLVVCVLALLVVLNGRTAENADLSERLSDATADLARWRASYNAQAERHQATSLKLAECERREQVRIVADRRRAE